MLPPGTSSVPVYFSEITKKSIVGFRPIEKVFEELN
jgi:hypothetical protein